LAFGVGLGEVCEGGGGVTPRAVETPRGNPAGLQVSRVHIGVGARRPIAGCLTRVARGIAAVACIARKHAPRFSVTRGAGRRTRRRKPPLWWQRRASVTGATSIGALVVEHGLVASRAQQCRVAVGRAWVGKTCGMHVAFGGRCVGLYPAFDHGELARSKQPLVVRARERSQQRYPWSSERAPIGGAPNGAKIRGGVKGEAARFLGVAGRAALLQQRANVGVVAGARVEVALGTTGHKAGERNSTSTQPQGSGTSLHQPWGCAHRAEVEGRAAEMQTLATV
jgi:hypothetical protein